MFFYLLPKNHLEKQSFYIPNEKKDICDYDLRCIMSSGLMVDDIIMDHIKIIQSSHNYTEEHDCVFTHIDTDMIYIYRGSLQDLCWKKETYECINMPCEHYTIKRNEVKRYWARVLKKDTTLFEINELVDDCLFTFEKFHKQYIIIPSLLLDPLLIVTV